LRQPAFHFVWQGLKEFFEHGHSRLFEEGPDHHNVIELYIRKRDGIGKLRPVEVADPGGRDAPDASA
jgi:hypothetical protein